MNRLLCSYLLATCLAQAGETLDTNYFGADAFASIRRVTREEPWDPGVTAAGFIHTLTNLYPTMLAYAQELPLAPESADRPNTFRFSWAGTSVNPSCFVVRLDLGNTVSRLAAAQFFVASRRGPPYEGLARGERTLSADECRRLAAALNEFLVARPLAYPGTGAIDLCPELFEYRSRDRHVVALANGISCTNVLGELHQLCLEAVHATRLQQPIGSVNGSQPVQPATNSTPSTDGFRR